jgi:predicted acylesterase/phospholipase RssA
MSAREPRRALILAGGGLKVAAQAGVLQVWLDEAGVEFHLADGASGGVFNLAMWCQGKSGTQIAQAWRDTNPLSWLWFSASPWRSISSLERFENNVLPRWGIDWDAIASNGYDATRDVLARRDGHAATPRRRDAPDVVSAAGDRRRRLHRLGLRDGREPRECD